MINFDEFHEKRKAVTRRRMTVETLNDVTFKQKPSKWKRFFIKFTIIMSILGILGMGAAYFAFITITSPYKKWAAELNLEDVNNLDDPCVIYDRNGEVIGRIYDENRSYVTLDQIAPCMLNALVAQEDKTFWTHNGFDPIGIARAAKAAISAGGKANQGASTITQQLARGAYDLERRTKARSGTRYERKIVEIYLAMRLEKKYSKQQIIEFYLNRIYFGRGFYGIRVASLGYFGKEPIDLTVREAASIAALIKNPSRYNPIDTPELNFRWRNDVLDRMRRENYLSFSEAERIKKMPLETNPLPMGRNTSFLNNLIQNQVVSLFKDGSGEALVKSAGIRVYTTIDKSMQDAAEESLDRQLLAIESSKDYANVKFADKKNPGFAKHRYLDGLVYAVDNKTGGVLAYVGGRSFANDNFDLIASGKFAPGTAIFPFLYATAFDNGLNPCTRLVDDALDNRLTGIGGSEGILGEWGMELKKGRYLDYVTVRQALSWSKISATARLGMRLGAKSFIEELEMVGLTPPPRKSQSTEINPEYYPRVYLGTEAMSLKSMVMAYTIFPNSGERPISPYIVTKVTDSRGNVLWEEPKAHKRKLLRAMQASTSYRVHSILRDSLIKGAAMRLQTYLPDNFQGAVKTGTNYDFSDNCLIGYSSSVTCGVWMGFLLEQREIYPMAFSSDTCGPVMGEVLKAAVSQFGDKPIAIPSDTQEVEICLASGQMATDFCFETALVDGKRKYERYTYLEYFPKGDVSLGICSVHGDGAPSLIDVLGRNMGNSRVLPLIPILPKESALLGSDPYNSELKLNPRYKNKEMLLHYSSSLNPGIDMSDESAVMMENNLELEGRLEMPLPPSIRYKAVEIEL